jgi:hypothetical protein
MRGGRRGGMAGASNAHPKEHAMSKLAFPLMAALLSGSLIAPPLRAQNAPVVIAPASSGPKLLAGSEVRLQTLQEISSQTAKPGDRFDLEVIEDVTLQGHVVIQRGARAVGEITAVRKKGMWGKSGGLTTQLLYVRVGDQQIRLKGAVGEKGKTGTGGVVASVAFVPVAGFFVTGTSAVVPARTATTAYLDADLPVAFAAAARR